MFGNKCKDIGKVKVRLHIEKAQVYGSCFDIDYGDTEDFDTFHLKTETLTAKEYMPKLREEFGTKHVEYESIGPRNILFFSGLFKYKIKGNEPLWLILRPNGEVYRMFRGIPSYGELRETVRNLMIKEEFIKES